MVKGKVRGIAALLVVASLIATVSCGNASAGNTWEPEHNDTVNYEDTEKEVPEDTTETEKVEDVKELAIPDIANIEESIAKTLLVSNFILPNIIYEYNDEVEKGMVIRTDPEIGTVVEKNAKIDVYVSEGKSLIDAKDGRITWDNAISDAQDTWKFNRVYIEDKTLKINCYEVVFGVNITWLDNVGDGKLHGIAKINGKSENQVPVSAVYENQATNAGDKQAFVLEMPLSDLDIEKPNSANIILYADVNGKSREIKVNFTFSW